LEDGEERCLDDAIGLRMKKSITFRLFVREREREKSLIILIKGGLAPHRDEMR
jgi:hypothetical protein